LAWLTHLETEGLIGAFLSAIAKEGVAVEGHADVFSAASGEHHGLFMKHSPSKGKAVTPPLTFKDVLLVTGVGGITHPLDLTAGAAKTVTAWLIFYDC
jgi:hypothetical protein